MLILNPNLSYPGFERFISPEIQTDSAFFTYETTSNILK